MASVAAAVVGWLATYLLHSTLLIGGAWLLTRSQRLGPAARDLLWKAALVGGLATSTAAVLAAAPGALRVVTAVDATELRTFPEGPAWSGDGAVASVHVEARIVEVGPECRARLRGDALAREDRLRSVREACGTLVGAPPAWRWYEIGAALWLLGAMTGLTFLLRDYRALHSLHRRLRSASARADARLAEVLRGRKESRWAGGRDLGSLRAPYELKTRLRGLRLGISDEIEGPCVLPGRTVALPARCEEELTEAELRAVLAHEIAHVARRDVLWSTALRALSSVLWIQPLNRLAVAGCTEAAELACDDWALARTGERYGLASSISRVALWSLGASAAVGVPMIGRTGEGGLARRVRRILADGPRGPERRWLRAALAAMLVLPMYWLPAVPAPSTTVRALVLARTERIRLDSTSAGTVAREEPGELRAVLTRTEPPRSLLGGEAERHMIFRMREAP